ncbi:MAG TPA: TetR family transcriptional regulator [Nocardia sp.]|uniref:TetR/AcrR family transcriptional regulator n=1 Tax=Nocardia sp. TaxID=1821 RepID=UPI002B4B1B6D|nr:TetR family transcriptional regulator [Nocardia sp.]HLS76929.1 TetR family transcriptional regulator [Nocardia sp.]
MSEISERRVGGHPGADPSDTGTPRCAQCHRPVRRAERGRPRRYCSRSCSARAYRARRAARAAGTTAERRPPRPGRLTRVAIATTAVALADRDGLDGLTMRRLAGELGVATAALYRHYPDRAALLAAMTELVMAEHAEVAAPPPDDPRTALAVEAAREWGLYRDHPWMLPTLARLSPPLGPSLFDTLERSFAALEELRVSPEDRLTAYLALSGLVQGLALLRTTEHGPRRDSRGDAPARAEFEELLAPGARPALHRALAAAASSAAPDLDALLAESVALLLDGITARRGGREAGHSARHAPGRALRGGEPTE